MIALWRFNDPYNTSAGIREDVMRVASLRREGGEAQHTPQTKLFTSTPYHNTRKNQIIASLLTLAFIGVAWIISPSFKKVGPQPSFYVFEIILIFGGGG